MTWRDFLISFRPERGSASPAEAGRSAVAAIAAIAAVVALSAWLLPAPTILVTAVGASAVLVFALPASPMAQPWSVVGGYLVCALAGVAAAKLVPQPALAGGLAVGLAIVAMLAARCLHPPGGAVALFAVAGGESVHSLGFQYVLSPVLANALLLAGTGLVVNNLLPGRRYPRPHPEANPHLLADPEPLTRLGLRHDDLSAALAEYGRSLYISGEELDEILRLAEGRSGRRRYGPLTCADIMSRDVVSVRPDTTLLAAWHLMHRHHLEALPVVDSQSRMDGIVTLESFVRAARARRPGGLRGRLYRLLRYPATRDQGVSSIMTRSPVRAAPETHVVDLVPEMSRGLHQVPVVDAENRLLGIVTQSDLVAALYHGCVGKAR